ncbi:MAG TPA: fluoride efflux transporter CrcB [Alphaproteobacteria bacterium]|nr:fluoride efflux transporter CrcB [Alphaproteobacteria bacterium]|tara:strand:- start:499 stop:894 length:396 start_codon:yes stop_codon:yes gene_type:complete
MIIWLAIALGGALGALTRYGVSQAVIMLNDSNQATAPLATVMVNVIGSGLMGVIYGYLSAGGMLSEALRVFLMVGFLGALTTFSTFSMDVMVIIDRGAILHAVVYAAVSVAGSVLIFMLAVQMMRSFGGAG